MESNEDTLASVDAATVLYDVQDIQTAIDAASAELTLPITPSTDNVFPYSNNLLLASKRVDAPPMNECNNIKKMFENVVLPPILSSKKANNKIIFKKPKKMTRAKYWSKEVENLFRYQSAGFRDYNEYIEVYEEPEVWIDTINENLNGLVRCLKTKQSGLFMYFRQTRECADKYLNKIKLYEY